MRTSFDGFKAYMHKFEPGHIEGESRDGFYTAPAEFKHLITDYILDHYCLDKFGEIQQQQIPSEATKRYLLLDCIKCNAYLFSEFLSEHLKQIDLLAFLAELMRVENTVDYSIKNDILNKAWKYLEKIIEDYLYRHVERIFGVRLNPYLDSVIDEQSRVRDINALLARK